MPDAPDPSKPGASESGDGAGGWLRWLVGAAIALLAAGGGIVALLTYFGPPPPSSPGASPSAGTGAPVACAVSGTVYNRDSDTGLSAVTVGYLRRTEDESEYQHDVRSVLATTDAEGRFEADCSWVEPENFPLRLTLARAGWCVTYNETNEFVRLGQSRRGVNLYVSDDLLRTMCS